LAPDLEFIVKYGERFGAEFVDVRYHDTLYELIEIDNGVVRTFSTNIARGVGVRVVVEGYMGYASTNTLDSESLKRAVERAVKVAKSMKKAGSVTRFYQRKTVKDKVVSHYAKDPLDVSPEEKLEFLLNLYKLSRTVSGVVSSIVRYGFEKSHRIYTSSNGDYVEQTTRLIGVGSYLVSSVEGVMERLWDSRSRVAGWEFIERGVDW